MEGKADMSLRAKSKNFIEFRRGFGNLEDIFALFPQKQFLERESRSRI